MFVCFLGRCGPTQAMVSSFLRFLDHTQRRITFGRTLRDEWSARRRDLYLTTHNTYSRQTSMPPVGFEPTISASERPQTYALDRAASGTGASRCTQRNSSWYPLSRRLVRPRTGLDDSDTKIIPRCCREGNQDFSSRSLATVLHELSWVLWLIKISTYILHFAVEKVSACCLE